MPVREKGRCEEPRRVITHVSPFAKGPWPPHPSVRFCISLLGDPPSPPPLTSVSIYSSSVWRVGSRELGKEKGGQWSRRGRVGVRPRDWWGAHMGGAGIRTPAQLPPHPAAARVRRELPAGEVEARSRRGPSGCLWALIILVFPLHSSPSN